MSPCFSGPDHRDGPWRNIKTLRQSPNNAPKIRLGPDTPDVFIGQDCEPIFDAASRCSVDDFVAIVSGWGVPPEIGRTIVFLVAIIVTGLISNGTGTDKRFKNQRMRISHMWSAILQQTVNDVTSPGQRLLA
jgi:hypothetical protein